MAASARNWDSGQGWSRRCDNNERRIPRMPSADFYWSNVVQRRSIGAGLEVLTLSRLPPDNDENICM
jgi:hypothetical protein